MPSKKRKYNSRFPAVRIKKIMQTDEEVGKIAQPVPVIISRILELFVNSLLTKSLQVTQGRKARTLTPSHLKQCILAETRFDFLKDLVKNVPDVAQAEEKESILTLSPDSSPTALRISDSDLQPGPSGYNEQSSDSASNDEQDPKFKLSQGNNSNVNRYPQR